ncbi:MAG: hypothetical protein LBK26_00320 [Rickettsiales bacterium]|jgi:hypothetical protein|nr:hypothetical protein [Rickettsiales bacterium]
MQFFTRDEIKFCLGDDAAKTLMKMRGTARDAAFSKIMEKHVRMYDKQDLNKSPIKEITGFIFKSWAALTYSNAIRFQPDATKLVDCAQNGDSEKVAISSDMITTARDAAIILEELQAGYKILDFAPPTGFTQAEFDVPRLDVLAGLLSDDGEYGLHIQDIYEINDALDIFIEDYMDNARRLKTTKKEAAAFNDPDNYILDILDAEPNGFMKTKVLDWVYNFYNLGRRESLNASDTSMTEIMEKISPVCNGYAEILQECADWKTHEPDFKEMTNIPVSYMISKFVHYIQLVPAIAGEAVPLDGPEISKKFKDFMAQMNMNLSAKVMDYMLEMIPKYAKLAINGVAKNPQIIRELRPTARHYVENYNHAIKIDQENKYVAYMGSDAHDYNEVIEKCRSFKTRQRNIAKKRLAENIRK